MAKRVVRDHMSTKVFTVRFDKKAIAVQEIMTWGRLRHVPVVDAHHQLVGIISHRDLLHAAVASVADVPAAERRLHLAQVPIVKVMQSNVTVIAPDASVQDAARMLRQAKFGCLPVVQDGKLIGIITEHDLLGIVENLSD
jgi:CBS domain-containing membrane protein